MISGATRWSFRLGVLEFDTGFGHRIIEQHNQMMNNCSEPFYFGLAPCEPRRPEGRSSLRSPSTAHGGRAVAHGRHPRSVTVANRSLEAARGPPSRSSRFSRICVGYAQDENRSQQT